MTPKTEDMWLQRLSQMTDEQQNILTGLYNKVFDCEGEGMPRMFWCKSCEATFVRFRELFIRFELLNMQHEQIYNRRNTSTHPGFFGYDHN